MSTEKKDRIVVDNVVRYTVMEEAAAIRAEAEGKVVIKERDLTPAQALKLADDLNEAFERKPIPKE